MTELRSKLMRKTAANVQYKPLVVTLYPHHLEIRQERVRRPYSITWDAVYRYAAKLEADRVMAERKQKRKAARQEKERKG